jgi:biotin transport system ATP-binding protein
MLIQFKNVTLQREAKTVLSELNFAVSEPRVGILGPNGSGKSTLLRLINGLLIPQAGQIIVDDLDVRTNLAAVRRKVGFIFQNPDNQIILPVVREDIDFGIKKKIPEQRLRTERIEQSLHAVGATHLIDRVAHTLSGGEKQLVALAAVLAASPDILMFDEPTNQLDLKHHNRFVSVLNELPQSCLIASHDLELLSTMDRVLVIQEGRLAWDGAAPQAIDWYRSHCG